MCGLIMVPVVSINEHALRVHAVIASVYYTHACSDVLIFSSFAYELNCSFEGAYEFRSL